MQLALPCGTVARQEALSASDRSIALSLSPSLSLSLSLSENTFKLFVLPLQRCDCVTQLLWSI